MNEYFQNHKNLSIILAVLVTILTALTAFITVPKVDDYNPQVQVQILDDCGMGYPECNGECEIGVCKNTGDVCECILE